MSANSTAAIVSNLADVTSQTFLGFYGIPGEGAKNFRERSLSTAASLLDNAFEGGSDSSEIMDTDNEEIGFDDIRLMEFAAFREFLSKSGICLTRYGGGWARTSRDLWVEVVLGASVLERSIAPLSSNALGATIHREVRSVMLTLHTTIAGCDRFLLMRDQVRMPNFIREGLYAPLAMNMFADESPTTALSRLGIQYLDQDLFDGQHFSLEECTVAKMVKESVSFPGLLTFYTIHKFTIHIKNPCHGDMDCIGLPMCGIFESASGSMMDENDLVSVMTWVSRRQFETSLLRWCNPADLEYGGIDSTEFRFDERETLN